jgi:hypothetical protein
MPKLKTFWPRIALAVAAGLLVLGLWPVQYLASPRWEIWVVKEDGQPLAGAKAYLTYQNYSAESDSHELTLETDEKGHALFLPRYESASFLQKVFYTVLTARAGVHASFGRHVYVFVVAQGYEGGALTGNVVADWQGTPESMESRIVAKKIR